MERLVVMDFSNGSVNVYAIESSENRSTEDILRDLGHNIDECSVMWCESVSINLRDYQYE